MDPTVAVRAYRSADLDEVVALWHDSKRKAWPYVPVQQAYTIDDDRAHFEQHIAKEFQIWIAEQGGQIIGFMALKGNFIEQLFVHVNHQRRGIGALLLKTARELSPSGLRLYTFQKNAAARAFYEREGFHMVKEGISPPPENEPDVEYAWSP